VWDSGVTVAADEARNEAGGGPPLAAWGSALRRRRLRV
jgi:hypothetical protein